MQLSDKEKEMATKLRKQQRFMIRWRWVFLLIVLLDYVSAIALSMFEYSLAENNRLALLALGIIVPTVYALLGAGTILLVYVVQRWNGKPEIRLLLRLIDELQKDDVP